jgi:hypothetical protein
MTTREEFMIRCQAASILCARIGSAFLVCTKDQVTAWSSPVIRAMLSDRIWVCELCLCVTELASPISSGALDHEAVCDREVLDRNIS